MFRSNKSYIFSFGIARINLLNFVMIGRGQFRLELNEAIWVEIRFEQYKLISLQSLSGLVSRVPGMILPRLLDCIKVSKTTVELSNLGHGKSNNSS